MATITIKCNTLGCFNGIECLSGINTAFSNAKNATENLAQAVEKLTIKLDAVKDMSELESVKETLQHAEQREEENNSALCCAYEKLDEFVLETGRIDNAVAEKIQERKNEFYKQYYYLKPECEKGLLEKIGNWFANTWNGFVDWAAQLGQAIADALVSIGKWIKEHITELCTALAVILLAVLAFIATPLTLIAIAAIAGIVSLALWVTDIICIVSCDKNLAGILRENGNEYWADVVDGVQWGCGIVELLFPASLLASAIKKTGLKAFGKAMLQSFKSSFKSFIDDVVDVFKGGKKGLSNIFNRIKKMVFDPDDFKTIKPEIDADAVLKEVQEEVVEEIQEEAVEEVQEEVVEEVQEEILEQSDILVDENTISVLDNQSDELLGEVAGGIEGGADVWDMTEGGGIINGREYSQHAMERMAPDTPSVRAELSRRAERLAESKGLQIGTPEYYQFCQKYVDPRDIPPSAIEDAIRNTNAVPGHTAGTLVHQTADVTVIVNEAGKVITVIPK